MKKINKYSTSVLAKWICYSEQSVVNWYDGKTMPQPQACVLISVIIKDDPQAVFDFFKVRYLKYWGKTKGKEKYLKYITVNAKYFDTIKY